MAVTATTVAAATTMMAAVAAVFLAFVLCFYIFAKRYRGAGAGGATPADGRGVAARLWFLFGGGGGGRGGDGGDGAAWCYDGGLDEASMAKLPCKVVGKEADLFDCAVCITELAAGETARVLPRCGHGFHVACVDMWLKSHSTCPLCRCPAVDDPPPPPAVQTPEVDPESPNFPTNVLFFGSQDDVSTAAGEEAARVARGGLRRLLGCGGASPPPPPAEYRDIEIGLAGGGESSSPAKSPRHPSS